MIVRTLDLFCGGGGSSWGAQAAGATIVGGIDADHVAAEAFALNFPAARAHHLKMTRSTRPHMLRGIGQIDLLLASPECTNHTHARGNRPIDENSQATAHFVVNFAADLVPRWIVIENVVQMRAWKGYARLICELQALGYRVEPVILDARHFGVPQQRRRLFVLCDLERAPPTSVSGVLTHPPTVASILDPPSTWPSRLLYRPGRAVATLERAERAMAALGRGRQFLIVYYGTDASGGWQRLDRPLRTITTLDRFGLVTWVGGEPYLRMLQVPELTRAMGFGDSYSIEGVGRRRDRIRLLGNGVAPPVMDAVVRTLVGDRALPETRSKRRQMVTVA